MRKGSGNLAEVPSTEKSVCVRITFLCDYDAVRDGAWFFRKDIGHTRGRNLTSFPKGTIMIIQNVPLSEYETDKDAVNAYGHRLFEAEIVSEEA